MATLLEGSSPAVSWVVAPCVKLLLERRVHGAAQGFRQSEVTEDAPQRAESGRRRLDAPVDFSIEGERVVHERAEVLELLRKATDSHST